MTSPFPDFAVTSEVTECTNPITGTRVLVGLILIGGHPFCVASTIDADYAEECPGAKDAWLSLVESARDYTESHVPGAAAKAALEIAMEDAAPNN